MISAVLQLIISLAIHLALSITCSSLIVGGTGKAFESVKIFPS